MLEAAVPTVEVQCHGGTAAVELVVSAFEKAGAQRCNSWQVTEHAASNRLAAEALDDLPHALTLLTAEILLDQAQGAFRRALVGLAEAIDRQPGAGFGRSRGVDQTWRPLECDYSPDGGS